MAHEEYTLWVKGSELKMNGEVVLKGKALGNVGLSWTKYHPEGEPPKPRERDPSYDERTERWINIFAYEHEERQPDKYEVDAMKLWHEKHDPKPDLMEIDPTPDEAKSDGDVEMHEDIPIYYVECFNIQNHKDQREVVNAIGYT